jgi:hypothetical protein
VVKINEEGKRQIRVIGIDGFKISNFSKEYKKEGERSKPSTEFFKK